MFVNILSFFVVYLVCLTYFVNGFSEHFREVDAVTDFSAELASDFVLEDSPPSVFLLEDWLEIVVSIRDTLVGKFN